MGRILAVIPAEAGISLISNKIVGARSPRPLRQYSSGMGSKPAKPAIVGRGVLLYTPKNYQNQDGQDLRINRMFVIHEEAGIHLEFSELGFMGFNGLWDSVIPNEVRNPEIIIND